MNREINIKEIIDFIKLSLHEGSALRSTLDTIKSGEWKGKPYY
ncbi:hypothetical protein QX233_09830 [Chryseobacterium gambrini]|uniref:Uncharacterized protein n=1 Tax=Chryseobacterium gambrini TaxID=373672 RepID=A0AAJ1R473_9FLAO|nr:MULTISPECIES: hypothetical protein [Chryseobacterium]MDN4012760.1 hypothetical protein [Chryseobacterium gambrini]MDN4030356.1 hypothetical protein [Chryseobacterium gambrini]